MHNLKADQTCESHWKHPKQTHNYDLNILFLNISNIKEFLYASLNISNTKERACHYMTHVQNDILPLELQNQGSFHQMRHQDRESAPLYGG